MSSSVFHHSFSLLVSCQEIFLKLGPSENPVKGEPTQVGRLEAFVIDQLHQAPGNSWGHVGSQTSEPTGHPDVGLNRMSAENWGAVVVVHIVVNRLARLQGGMFEPLEPRLKLGQNNLQIISIEGFNLSCLQGKQGKYVTSSQ